MWDCTVNGDTVRLEQPVLSCKDLTAQRSRTELAASGAACQALVPAAQGMFAGMEVFGLQAARLVGRPFGSRTERKIPL